MKKKGFTIIETIVGFLILSIIMTICLQSFVSYYNIKQSSDEFYQNKASISSSVDNWQAVLGVSSVGDGEKTVVVKNDSNNSKYSNVGDLTNYSISNINSQTFQVNLPDEFDKDEAGDFPDLFLDKSCIDPVNIISDEFNKKGYFAQVNKTNSIFVDYYAVRNEKDTFMVGADRFIPINLTNSDGPTIGNVKNPTYERGVCDITAFLTDSQGNLNTTNETIDLSALEFDECRSSLTGENSEIIVIEGDVFMWNHEINGVTVQRYFVVNMIMGPTKIYSPIQIENGNLINTFTPDDGKYVQGNNPIYDGDRPSKNYELVLKKNPVGEYCEVE